MLTWFSLLPSADCIGTSGGVNPSAPGVPAALSSPPPESVPHPATDTSSTAPARAVSPFVVPVLMTSPSQVVAPPDREQTRTGRPDGRVATTARHVVGDARERRRWCC